MTIDAINTYQPAISSQPELKASALKQAKPGSSTGDDKLRKACRDFESVLVNQMLTEMKKTVSKADLFGSSKKEEMFDSMLTEEISKESCKNGMFGLAEKIYAQMTQK